MHTAFSYAHMNRLTEERRENDGDRYDYYPAENGTRKQHYHYGQATEKNPGMQFQTGTIGNNTSVCGCDITEREENYCYNGENQLTERKNPSGITEYVYDENGSLICEKEGGKTTSYQYDLLNRQEKVWTSDGREQENLYDGEGLRAGLREKGKESAFLFYNGEILAECDGDGMPVRRHLQGMGLSYVQTLDDGMYHACHQDEQGSTAFITGDGGEVENSYVYDAFGNVLERKEGIRNDILYRGQKYDQEAGQYYLRARYYNPVIGRFIQEDSYRGDGLNLYAYCGNNPVMYYDPSGHTKVTQPITEPETPKAVGSIPSNFTEAEIDYLKNAVISEGQALKDMGLTNEQLGPAIAGAYDKDTGKIYTAINDMDGKVPSELSPFIQERISNMPQDVYDSYSLYTKGAASHAEVYAVNKLLLDNPNADISNVAVYVNRTLGVSKPMKELPFGTCPHCSYILDGFNIISNQ